MQERDTLIARANQLRSDLIASTAQVREVAELFVREPILRDALERVVRAEGVMRIERRLDENTAERMNLPRGQRVIFESVGRITAIDVIDSGKGKLKGDDLIAGLRHKAIDVLTRFSASSLRDLNHRQRKQRTKDIEQVKEVILGAEAHLARTRRFLRPSNLREFGKLPVDRHNNRSGRTLKHFAALTNEGVSVSLGSGERDL